MNPFPEVLRSIRECFERSTSCLEEADSAFAPRPGMFTAAQQVAHAAQAVEWFVEGAFRPEGFSIDFGAMDTRVRKVTSLAEARSWLARAFDRAAEAFGSRGLDELAAPLPPGPIMGGAPRSNVIAAISDHTAHHRGALTVYARLLDRVPAMPYGA